MVVSLPWLLAPLPLLWTSQFILRQEAPLPHASLNHRVRPVLTTGHCWASGALDVPGTVQNLNLFLLKVPKVIASWGWTPRWNVSPSLSLSETKPKQQLDRLDGVKLWKFKFGSPALQLFLITTVAKEKNWLQKLVNYFHIQRNLRPQISHQIPDRGVAVEVGQDSFY